MSFIKFAAVFALLCGAAMAISATDQAPAQKSKKEKLPVLKAKQALDNIRFISKEGRHTYYQRRSGDLQVSANFTNEVVMEGKKLTEYLISGSSARKKLVVVKDESFHSEMSHHKANEIYILDFGGDKPTKVASGTAPKLHQNDLFLSYFAPKEKKLKVRDLSSDKKPLSIQLLNPVNEFFTPEAFMPTPSDIIYSDINESGHEAFLMRSVLDMKTQTVFKSAYPGSKLEGCLDDENLYVGEFERGGGKGGSKIVKIPLYGNQNFQNFEVLYQTQQADVGNMVCSEGKIYFVKTLSYMKDLNLKESEVASLDLKTKDVSILTDFRRVTQLVDMDGMILSPFRGQYYIVKGGKNLIDDEIKKDKSI